MYRLVESQFRKFKKFLVSPVEAWVIIMWILAVLLGSTIAKC